eukprot:CAMPEP_0194593454 /NCGR_PEP_ID=MMETSP0292-20121207/23516_1 /TAXON_ID=39354 /ORGANISM="Heterosigma akashiwo, Strain CCMP2393" /LENGTH=43 /DNA_ID= /DNA_START= /DNA_END= /DNA_ORIENTATION=
MASILSFLLLWRGSSNLSVYKKSRKALNTVASSTISAGSQHAT